MQLDLEKNKLIINYGDSVRTFLLDDDEITPIQDSLLKYFVLDSGGEIKNDPAATPVATPSAGAVDSGETVALSCSTTGADIYYTTDGTVPTKTSTKYTSEIEITADTTIKAIAIAKNYFDSEILTAEYTVKEKVATPTADPEAKTYDSAQSVTLASATEGATIYYTVDGSAPTSESTEYTAAISISETTTIKAIAIKDGMTDSDVLEATYTIDEVQSVH